MDFQKLNLCEVLTCEPKIICNVIMLIESEHSYHTSQSIIIYLPLPLTLKKTKTNPAQATM